MCKGLIFLLFFCAGALRAEDVRPPGPKVPSTMREAPSSRWQRMLRQMDTNGDHRISKAEWLADAAGRFDAYDTDGSGFITEEKVLSLERKALTQFNADQETIRIQPTLGSPTKSSSQR